MGTVDILKSDIDGINIQLEKEQKAYEEIQIRAENYARYYKDINSAGGYITSKGPDNYDKQINFKVKYIQDYSSFAQYIFYQALLILRGEKIPLGYGVLKDNKKPPTFDNVNMFDENNETIGLTWNGNNWVPKSDGARWHGGFIATPPIWISSKRLLTDSILGLVLNLPDRLKRINSLKQQIEYKKKQLSDAYVNISKENINKKIETETFAKQSIANKANVNSMIVVGISLVIIFAMYKIIF